MKRFIRLKVKDHVIVHGYDAENREITETVTAKEWTTKLISLDRILSVSEKYMLTHYAYGRIIYWEYEGGLNAIATKLEDNEALIF